MPNLKRLLLFTVLLALLAGSYLLHAPSQTPLPSGSWRHAPGELAGMGVATLLGIIYGRTLLKILLRQGPLLTRLLPLPGGPRMVEKGRWLLPFLNKSHPYVGVATVLLILCHVSLEGLEQANLLLRAVLFLIAWQFAFGLFLLSRYQDIFVNRLKRYGYLAHSQLYSGIAIGLCAFLGHLLIQD